MTSPAITEQTLRTLVEQFYVRVRQDDDLAAIFETAMGDAWDLHLDRMTSFWSSVLLGAGSFHGDPMNKHAALPDLSSHHFDRWLELFEATLAEVVEDPLDREEILGRARNMRRALEAYACAPDPRTPTSGLLPRSSSRPQA